MKHVLLERTFGEFFHKVVDSNGSTVHIYVMEHQYI